MNRFLFTAFIGAIKCIPSLNARRSPDFHPEDRGLLQVLKHIKENMIVCLNQNPFTTLQLHYMVHLCYLLETPYLDDESYFIHKILHAAQ